MKRIYCCMLALAGMVSTGVQAQEANDAFIKIEEHNMFSQCFAPCDTNGDGVFTSADITALYDYLLNNDESHLVNGDQTGDGLITAADITAVYGVLLGESK